MHTNIAVHDGTWPEKACFQAILSKNQSLPDPLAGPAGWLGHQDTTHGDLSTCWNEPCQSYLQLYMLHRGLSVVISEPFLPESRANMWNASTSQQPLSVEQAVLQQV